MTRNREDPVTGTTSGSGGSPISFPRLNQKLFMALFSFIFLVAAATTEVTTDLNNSTTTSDSLSIIKSSCKSTSFPKLCFSTISKSPELSSKVTTQKGVIVASLKLIISAVEQNTNLIRELTKEKDLTKMQNISLFDCLELLNETLAGLHEAMYDLHVYPNEKSLSEYDEDMNTLLSAAISNQDTCLEAFSYSEADKKLREAFLAPEIKVEKMCRNALAMIKNMTDTDMAVATKARKLQQQRGGSGGGGGWPRWLSAGDRTLLERRRLKANVVVARDGSGDFRTVSEAVEAAPSHSRKRYVIKIKAGIYRENVKVPSWKPNIMFWGEHRRKTILAGDRSVEQNFSTFHTATVAVNGKHFLAKDVTFKNIAGPHNGQAVALRVSADKSAFYRCKFMAYQDTLYVHSFRQFFRNCYITGTVDFIFGYAAAVFQHSVIHPRRPNPGQVNLITAHARLDRHEKTGIVIQNSKIEASSDLRPVISRFPTYLGRPWRPYARTVIMKSRISHVIHPEGWSRWNKGDSSTDALVEYREHRNFGPGANTSNRVTWKGFKVIKSTREAHRYTAGKFISGRTWLRSTGFPYSLGM